MRPIYTAGWQGLKVRAVLVVAVVAAVAGCWWGVSLGASDGIGWELGVQGFCLVALIALLYYGSLYVVDAEFDGDATLRLTTLAVVVPVTWVVPTMDVVSARSVDMASRGGGSTPFVWVKVTGQGWRPRRFLVDLQGSVLDEPALEKALALA